VPDDHRTLGTDRIEHADRVADDVGLGVGIDRGRASERA